MDKLLTEMTNQELWSLFPIILTEHNRNWKEWYLEEQNLLIEIIGQKFIERINHIGSTSIIGLVAKPTIDILIEISNHCNTENLIQTLVKENYIYTPQPNNPPPHMMFMKGYTNQGFAEKVYHIHVRYLGDWNELYFRDYLIQNKDIAVQYSYLKLELKNKYEHDRDEYTNSKTEFVLHYSNIAKQMWKNRYKPD